MELREEYSELSTRALGAIRAAKLPHPHGGLLESFITEAADCDRAAEYVLDRLASEGDQTGTIQALCADWSRLVAYCETALSPSLACALACALALT